MKNILEVLLDPFHGMFRISKRLYKKHGAFIPFMKRFRDAVFLLDADDVKMCEDYLRTKRGMDEAAIAKYKQTNWSWFVKHWYVLCTCSR